MSYITVHGDTWDKIAKEVYGNEKHADFLMKNNFMALDMFVFPEGTIISTPQLPSEMNGDVPPWRE